MLICSLCWSPTQLLPSEPRLASCAILLEYNRKIKSVKPRLSTRPFLNPLQASKPAGQLLLQRPLHSSATLCRGWHHSSLQRPERGALRESERLEGASRHHLSFTRQLSSSAIIFWVGIEFLLLSYKLSPLAVQVGA